MMCHCWISVRTWWGRKRFAPKTWRDGERRSPRDVFAGKYGPRDMRATSRNCRERRRRLPVWSLMIGAFIKSPTYPKIRDIWATGYVGHQPTLGQKKVERGARCTVFDTWATSHGF